MFISVYNCILGNQQRLDYIKIVNFGLAGRPHTLQRKKTKKQNKEGDGNSYETRSGKSLN